MAVYKRDIAFNELFIKPIRGLSLEHTITIEEFKDRNASVMKTRWVDTEHSSAGEKIYELYDPEKQGELVKESFQEWLCDNRNEITQCIGIALRNHEKSFAEWFRYVDSRSSPDELALYGLSRKHGIHTTVFNKGYIWTTLVDHVLRSDEEIISLCGVNILFLDETTYGILRKIRAPNPTSTKQKTPVGKPCQKASRKTCREPARNKNNKPITEQPAKTLRAHGKRARTLSESRQVSFGIQAPPTVNRPLRQNRSSIDYLTLNDSLEEDELSSPRRKKKPTYRPGSGPSATRQAASKHTISPEVKTTDKEEPKAALPAVPSLPAVQILPVVPGTSQGKSDQSNKPLTGVPATTDDQLPDLVLAHDDPDVSQATGAVSTKEEIDAAETLLSLGEVRNDTLDHDDENAVLMPIGGPNFTVDVAPEPIRLDQVNVDKAIAELIQNNQNDKHDQPDQADKITDPKGAKKSTPPADADRDDTAEDRPKSDGKDNELPSRGRLETKTYALKKKVETRKRTFKCSECNVTKKTVKELNIHHEECHNPQICRVCSKLFTLASSLARHMYEHNKPKFSCDQCDYMCQFESELTTHKIVHRKNPSHQCMKANCGRWFMRKWDLTLHLQKHEGVRHNCDYDGCSFYADTKKQLKEHRKKHSDDHQHICTHCGKGFKYRSGLKRHRDSDH